MLERRRTGITLDRRSGMDRRKAYDLDYFQGGGRERRRSERRSSSERRAGWMPISRGFSVFVGEWKP